MDFIAIFEILVLVAIGIEVYVLYKHGKVETKMDERIQNICDRLLKSDEVMKTLDDHMRKFDEHTVRLDKDMNKVNEIITTLNEHLIRYDEHVNRLDDLIMKSYIQKRREETEEPTS